MAIKAIIWDFSGVLLKPLVPDPHASIARELGMLPQVFAAYFDGKGNELLDLGEESEVEFYHRIIQEQHLHEKDALRIFNRYFFDLFDLNSELMEFIRANRPILKMALCSNFSGLLRSLLEKKWKIMDDFDTVVISSEVKLLKPDARIYQMTLDRLELQPQEAIFVDDSKKNVESAKGLGMHGVWFQDNQSTLRQIIDLMS
jgi:putative hydrolase of the HAD superfamily